MWKGRLLRHTWPFYESMHCSDGGGKPPALRYRNGKLTTLFRNDSLIAAVRRMYPPAGLLFIHFHIDKFKYIVYHTHSNQ